MGSEMCIRDSYKRDYLELRVYCGYDFIPLVNVEDGVYRLTVTDIENNFGNNNCIRLLKDKIWKEVVKECTIKIEPYRDIERTAWNESHLFDKYDVKRNRSKRNIDLKKARSLEEEDIDKVDTSRWGYIDRDWRW